MKKHGLILFLLNLILTNKLYCQENLIIIKDIIYAKEKNILNNTEELKLDFYQKNVNKLNVRLNKPLIIFIHGGGFVSGDKAGGYPLLFCKKLASNGFSVASVNYRLGIDEPKNDSSYFEALLRGIMDVNQSLKFLKSQSEKLNIDTNQIFIMGGSAGSMIAMHLAYFKKDNLSKFLNGSIVRQNEILKQLQLLEKNNINGVINLWGAMIDYKWIHKNDPPLLSIHGELDKLVPIDSSLSYHPFKYGSLILNSHSENVGNKSNLIVFENKGHTLDNDTLSQNEAVEKSIEWIRNQVGIINFRKIHFKR